MGKSSDRNHGGTTLVSYDYGLDNYKGLAKAITYGSGRKVYYTYDYKDRVSTIGYAENTPRYTYTYTTDSEISSVYDSTLGLVTKYTDDGWKTYKGTPEEITELLYEYRNSSTDSENCSETVLGQAFSHTVENDENFTWLKVLDEAGLSVYQEKSEYDGFDRLKEKTLSIGGLDVSQKYTYTTKDGATGNRVDKYVVSHNKDGVGQKYTYAYSYDGNGNIVRVVERHGVNYYVTEYTYDEAGQLIEAYDGKAGIRYRYSYDAYGNIVGEDIYTINSNETETLKESIINEYDGMILTKSHSSLNGTTTYGSDSSKNISSIYSENQSLVLQWKEGRRLTQVRDMKNQCGALYAYNDEGLRVKKTLVGGETPVITEYVWGQNGLAGFTQGENTVVVHYGQDGTPVGFSLNDTVYTYIKNIQGDILRILDTTGNTVVEYSYDPWGAPTVTGDTELAAINPCSYRGYNYDEETGFYYLQSRYYDPTVGRFISSDDISFLGASGTVLGYNLFTYCLNNPINMFDDDGRRAKSIWSLKSDAQGIDILWHYLYGNGKPFIKKNGSWGKYMMKNSTLKKKVQAVLFPIGKKLKKGTSKNIDEIISMEIDNGEDIIGYQYLHGTNANAGGFRIKGKISKDKKGNITYDLTYTWNDIIDPNFSYASDKMKAEFAKKIPFANPTDYKLSISWTDKSVIKANPGVFNWSSGWLK